MAVNISPAEMLKHGVARAVFRLRRRRKVRQFVHERHAGPGERYSLAPFDKYKCIFVSVPKAGSTSIAASLFGPVAVRHRSISEYQRLYSAFDYYHYFKFAFTRNPWDRLLSAYRYCLAQPKYFPVNQVQWVEENVACWNDFSGFVKGWVSTNKVEEGVAYFRPQWTFVSDSKGNLGVDFLGKIENQEEDFKFVVDKINVSATLKRLNVTRSKKDSDYRYSYDQEAAEIVAQVYSSDIENFGYRFDPD